MLPLLTAVKVAPIIPGTAERRFALVLDALVEALLVVEATGVAIARALDEQTKK
jgi:hypothetical protein